MSICAVALREILYLLGDIAIYIKENVFVRETDIRYAGFQLTTNLIYFWPFCRQNGLVLSSQHFLFDVSG